MKGVIVKLTHRHVYTLLITYTQITIPSILSEAFVEDTLAFCEDDTECSYEMDINEMFCEGESNDECYYEVWTRCLS